MTEKIENQKVAQNEPTAIDIIRDLADNCRWEDALEQLELLEEKYPDNPDVLYEFARIYFELGNYPTAISYYENLIELHETPVMYFNLGMAYEANDEKDRAISNYLKCLAINPKFSFAYKKLGTLFMARGDNEDAKEYFTDYLTFDVSADEAQDIKKIIERL
ncbi:tetratricopeptide repeat protein [bacterium]|nr:tetratricopeptide repeat protein [bacterium]